MEGSKNSMEESQQKSINNPENLPVSIRILDATRTNSIRSEHAKEIKNNNDIQPKKNNLRLLTSGHHKNRSIRKNQEASWIKKTKYKNVHIKMSNIDSSGKKWWRFFKWFPGLKGLKFPRGSTVPEDRVFDETGNPHEELSMTMWNVRDNNKQRPM